MADNKDSMMPRGLRAQWQAMIWSFQGLRAAWLVESSFRTEVLLFVVLAPLGRSEEHTSELQSLMRISYAVFCLKKKTHTRIHRIYVRVLIRHAIDESKKIY